jgi:hypothetical protein
VVVAVGWTVAVELGFVSAPTPLLMLMLVAPVTLQERAELWPLAMLEGPAVNEAMLGACPGWTATVVVAVTVPFAFVAVRT